MSVGTRVDSTSGVVTTNNNSGFSIERSVSNYGFSPFKVDSVQALTGSTTLYAGNAGVLTISGSTVLTQSMPTAASCPGATFVFRNLSAHAHVLTGSQETAGTKAFVSALSGAVTGQGSKLVLSGAVGGSVVLMSDGLYFHALSYSGSFAVSGA